MRLLVTGASGLLGINLALDASAQHTVVGLVHSHALNDAPFETLPADLSRPESIARVLEHARPDAVVHAAAMASLDACEAQPELAWRVNAESPGWLAEACRKRGARLLYVSTDAVFDGTRGGWREEDEPNPLSVYARSKLAGERAVLEAYPQAIVVRVNFYGWSLNGQRSLAEFFFNHLSAGRQMMGFTDVFFCPLLANHLAGVLVKMLAQGLNGVYHAVSRECLSKYDFGVALARRFGLDETLIRPASVAEAGLAAARSPDLRLSSAKLANALGEALPDQASGLERFFVLYQQGYAERVRAMAA